MVLDVCLAPLSINHGVLGAGAAFHTSAFLVCMTLQCKQHAPVEYVARVPLALPPPHLGAHLHAYLKYCCAVWLRHWVPLLLELSYPLINLSVAAVLQTI